MSEHLFVSVADGRYALQQQHVKAVHKELPTQVVAGTQPWFLGIAVCEGRLIPVSDLGSFCAMRPSTGSTIELNPSIALAALRVDSVSWASGSAHAPKDSNVPSLHHRQNVSEQQTSALANATNPNKTPNRDSNIGLFEFVTGEIVSVQGESHHVLDVHSLVHSDRFINIKD